MGHYWLEYWCGINGVTLIDRYILKRFFLYYLAALLVVVAFFIAIDSTSNLLMYEISLSSLVRYYAYALPSLIYEMTPIAALVSTVFTVTGMNRTNELLALFSCGMSLARISAPILVGVTTLSCMGFYAGDHILPEAAKKKNYIYYVEIINRPGLFSTIKTDRIWYRSRNTLFNIKTLKPEKNMAQGLTLYYFDEHWNLVEMINAKDVMLKGETWQLQDGSVTLFVEESSFPLTQAFKEKTIVMGEDTKDLQSSDKQSDTLTRHELKSFIHKNKEAGLDTVSYEVDYHAKYAYALVAFVMAFLGIPFSVTQRRSAGVMKNVGACVGLAFIFYVLYTSCLTIGRHGMIPPIVAAWVPNISMLILTVGFLLRLKK